MGANEDQLRKILDEGHWDVPSLVPLETALDGLLAALKRLRASDGWSGKAAEAANAKFVTMESSYTAVRSAVEEIRGVVANANLRLDDARRDYNQLPSGAVPGWLAGVVQEAREAGHAVARPLPDGPEFAVDSAIDGVANWLTGNREDAAKQALATLETSLAIEARKLAEPAVNLNKAIGDSGEATRLRVGDSSTAVDSPTSPGGTTPGTGGTPIGVRPPAPIRPPASVRPPGGGTLVAQPAPPTFGITDPTPILEGPGNPTPPPPTPTPLPGPQPGPQPGPGVTPGAGGGPGGINGGLTASLAGGGAAVGALGMHAGATRMGLTGGSLAAGGLGGAPGSGSAAGTAAAGAPMRGPAGTGGLLSGGAAAPGGSATGGSATGGAGTGSGQGMMGGQGGGQGKGAKDKRSRLGGPIAPRLEDDEDFVPQSDAARAGSREDDD